MKTESLASRLSERNTLFEGISGARYERHLDCAESMDDSSSTDSHPVYESVTPESKCHWEIHSVILPEKYHLFRGCGEKKDHEEKKRKKEKYKKVKKNVRKALKCTWKCIMLGLYNFGLGYSTTMSVATTFPPDFHEGGSWQ